MKPFNREIPKKEQEDCQLNCSSGVIQSFPEIIFSEKKMKDLFESVKKIAPSNSPVLILGETGTGKELVAKAIHEQSGRVKNKLIPVNCSAIPETILEAELFGYEKGAFTGADRTRPGLLDAANEGTLFLDEIGDMPLRLQAKLLRVLQEKKYRPLGSQKEKDVTVRFIAATHKDLEAEVKANTFRADLFYRLNVLPLRIPSLRERRKDIPLLISYFLNVFNRGHQKEIIFSEEVIDLFISYSWPGNVRELQNVVERICLLKDEGEVLIGDIPLDFKKDSDLIGELDFIFSENEMKNESLYFPESGIDLDAYLEKLSRSYIKEALLRTQNNKKEAARLLSLNRTTLVERIKKRIESGNW